MSAPTVVNDTNLPVVTDELVIDYLKSMGLSVDDDQAKKFITIAKSMNLNPFLKEIYAIPYGKNWNIIVGYEVYIKRAARSGKLDGWRAWVEGSLKDGNLKGCVEIKVKGWDSPFYHEVYFEEYNQNNTMWKSKPRTMIQKVAISQGFRLAFPEELSGMPYTAEEGVEEVTDTQALPKQESNDNLKEEFTNYLLNNSVPKQAFKSFSDFSKKRGFELEKEEIKIKLLEDKELFNRLIESFLDEAMG